MYQSVKLQVATQKLMGAALPLLSQLRRPALLLPGPLQAVVKAQRIVLADGEEYMKTCSRIGPFGSHHRHAQCLWDRTIGTPSGCGGPKSVSEGLGLRLGLYREGPIPASSCWSCGPSLQLMMWEVWWGDDVGGGRRGEEGV